jgi:Lecithin retinol acyltransferase
MAMGDHIRVPQYGILTHDGIDCGEGRVVEYSKEQRCIRETSFEEFANGRRVSVVRYRASYEPREVVARARSRVGEREYHLVGNNCEHFATWCKAGRHQSRQVDATRGVLIASAALAGLALLGALFGRGRA